MALYASAVYRAAYEFYAAALAQSAVLVIPSAIADPSAVAITPMVSPYTTGMAIGPCELPSVTGADNFSPITGIGVAKAVGQTPGRHDVSFGTQGFISDGAFLVYGVRNHTAVGAGTNKGLQMLTVEVGTNLKYTPDQWSMQGIDSLINTMSFEFQEGQPLRASWEVIPTCLIAVTPDEEPIIPPGDVLYWSLMSWTIGGTDYKPILAGGSVAVNNNIQRVGCRGVLPMTASISVPELAISRTAYGLVPGLEELRVSYTLHDRLPVGLQGLNDWGDVTLYAIQPGAAVGRKWFSVVIHHSFANTLALQRAAANGLQSFSLDVAAYDITVTSGATSA